MWSDVTSFVSRHKVAIGIGLGILAIATGGAGLAIATGVISTSILSAGAAAGVGAGLSAVAVASGTGAAIADEAACTRGDTAACFGLGFTGALLGAPGIPVGVLVAGNVIGAESGLNAAALALGAGGFQFGTFVTINDIVAALTHNENG